MNKEPHAKNAFVIERPCIDQIALVFPEDSIQETLAVLHSLPGTPRGKAEASRQCPPEQELAGLLEQLGWNCAQQNNGSLVVTDYSGQQLDLERNPVLVSAAGIVAPGSFVLGHAAHELAPTWWVSYTAQEKQVHQGLPTQEQVRGLKVCPECGSLNPRDWHHIQYTAIRYPVKSVDPLHITISSEGEALYECVIKEYLECRCGAELVRNGRAIL